MFFSRKGRKGNKDDLGMGFHPIPRIPANHQRLTSVQGLGQSPSSRIFYTLYTFYTVKTATQQKLIWVGIFNIKLFNSGKKW